MFTTFEAVSSGGGYVYLPPGRVVRLIVVIENAEPLAEGAQYHALIESRTDSAGRYSPSTRVLSMALNAGDGLVLDTSNLVLDFPQQDLGIYIPSGEDFAPDTTITWHVWAVYDN